jgi:hypothetical protein
MIALETLQAIASRTVESDEKNLAIKALNAIANLTQAHPLYGGETY